MDLNKKILGVILQIIFGLGFGYKLHQTAQNDFFLDGIILGAIALPGIFVFVWTIFTDGKDFKSTRQWNSYLPTFIGLLLIVANVGLYYYQECRKNAPTLISGFYDGGFNGVSLDLKTNGNYILSNGSGFGQSYSYGTYTLLDSIITLHRSTIDQCIKSNRLVIRTGQYYLKESSGHGESKVNYITPINPNGTEIDSEFRIYITIDGRTK